MRVVVAPDKFRGTATAQDVIEACRDGLPDHEVAGFPMSDGGEGLLDALGGANRRTSVTGPLGEPVEAAWRMQGREAVIEMAAASGLVVAGGADANRPLEATTRGTGELVMEAIVAGARQVVVGVGGSATTDGGLGAVEAIATARLRGVRCTVVCDVGTRFVDAAATFAPQKGATPSQVTLLERRLVALADTYRREYGVDVRELAGGGAAGGLAGGLAAIGFDLVPGAAWVGERVGVDVAVGGADAVITGEGLLDGASFDGKVVSWVLSQARSARVPAVVVCGDVDPEVDRRRTELDGVELISLVERFGADEALGATATCIARAVGAASTMMHGGPTAR